MERKAEKTRTHKKDLEIDGKEREVRAAVMGMYKGYKKKRVMIRVIRDIIQNKSSFISPSLIAVFLFLCSPPPQLLPFFHFL